MTHTITVKRTHSEWVPGMFGLGGYVFQEGVGRVFRGEREVIRVYDREQPQSVIISNGQEVDVNEDVPEDIRTNYVKTVDWWADEVASWDRD